MKILIVADLHFRRDWYAWLTRRKVDLVVIAGDLLDGFSPDGLLHQMLELASWSKGFPLPLALCSGNHDHNIRQSGFDSSELIVLSENQQQAAAKMARASRWMDMLERQGIVVDARSVLMATPAGQIVVTTIPYDFGEMPGDTEALWKTGASLRKEFKVPWLVLHHDPPADTTVGGPMGEPHLFYQIRSYRPDFVASGHIHDQPYRGDFIDRLDVTWCLNPGRPPENSSKTSKIPNHIVLDLIDGSATWHAVAKTGDTPILKKRILK